MSQTAANIAPANRPAAQWSAGDVVKLQRSVGNRAVTRLLRRRSTPAAPGGLSAPLQAQLTVGAAGDAYEHEAERISRSVVDQINRTPAPAVVRRADEDAASTRPAPAAAITRFVRREPQAPSVGLGGGPVDASSAAHIEQARGNGAALPSGFKGKLESAFGADFSGVRLHTDRGADQLNRSLSARAFTTGQDVFFKSGEYNPASRSGQALLAHELTHVVQQTGSIARQPVGQVQRAGEVPDDLRERMPTTGNEALLAGKPTAVGLTAGAIETGGKLGGLGAATEGLAGGAATGLGFADSMMTLYNARQRRLRAEATGDKAGVKIAEQKKRGGWWAAIMSFFGMGQSSLNAAASMKHGSEAVMGMSNLTQGAQYASTALGTAGAATGIVGGALTTAQGAWKIGQAAGKLRRLSARSAQVITDKARRWEARVRNREWMKIKLNSLKVVAGVLAITAGALILASNPIGWAIGIGATIGIAGLAIGKALYKWWQSRKRRQVKEQMRDLQPSSYPEVRRLGEAQGEAADARQRPVDRRRVVALANEIATHGSENATVAGEMRNAVTNGDPAPIDNTYALAETYGHVTRNPLDGDALVHNHQRLRPAAQWLRVPGQPGPEGEPGPETRVATTTPELPINEEAYDAKGLLGVLNITPDEVKTESGQELIEKKLAAAESI